MSYFYKNLCLTECTIDDENTSWAAVVETNCPAERPTGYRASAIYVVFNRALQCKIKLTLQFSETFRSNSFKAIIILH